MNFIKADFDGVKTLKLKNAKDSYIAKNLLWYCLDENNFLNWAPVENHEKIMKTTRFSVCKLANNNNNND